MMVRRRWVALAGLLLMCEDVEPLCQDVMGYEVDVEDAIAEGGFRAATLFDDQAWGVGDSGVVARFTDEGIVVVDAGVTADLHAVLGEDRLIAVGADGTLVVSDDGVQWTLAEVDVTADLYGLARLDDDVVAVGDDVVVVSHDGGVSWQVAVGGASAGPLRFVAAHQNHFYGFTDDGQVLRIEGELATYVALDGDPLPGAPRAVLASNGGELTVVLVGGEEVSLILGATSVVVRATPSPCGAVGHRIVGDVTLCDDGRLQDHVDGAGGLIEPYDPASAAVWLGPGFVVFAPDGTTRQFGEQVVDMVCEESDGGGCLFGPSGIG